MNRIRLVVAVVLLLLVGPSALWADEIDSLVQAHLKQRHIPGLSLAIVKEGGIVLAKGCGFANVEHQIPAKPETVYQSGSTGKQFTATAVMMLAEEGKLGLDDKISKYLTGTP